MICITIIIVISVIIISSSGSSSSSSSNSINMIIIRVVSLYVLSGATRALAPPYPLLRLTEQLLVLFIE